MVEREAEVVAFLSSLGVERHVAASTQNQALSALVFFYGEVLNMELDWLQGLVRVKRPERLPVVLTQDEVRRLLAQLQGTEWLMASPCTAPGCVYSSVPSCASRMSTSRSARFVSATGKAERTA
jgi:integrase